MRPCCFSCGMIVGMLLAVVAAAVIAGYYYFREEPAKARAQVAIAEKHWEKIKKPVDDGFKKAKETLPPPEQTPKEKINPDAAALPGSPNSGESDKK